MTSAKYEFFPRGGEGALTLYPLKMRSRLPRTSGFEKDIFLHGYKILLGKLILTDLWTFAFSWWLRRFAV